MLKYYSIASVSLTLVRQKQEHRKNTTKSSLESFMLDRDYCLGSDINRRQLIRIGLSGLVGVSSLKATGVKAAPAQRLAIIGGGMGGIASAYFCDSAYSIDLFESRPKIGGNADSIAYEEGGRTISVDIGAEFFHPETHPAYWSLLEDIGAISTPRKNTDILIPVPASLSIFDFKSKQPLFASQRPLDSFLHAISFAIYSQNARSFMDHSPDPNITIKDWVDSLWLANDFKKKILLPWFASLTAGTLENLSRTSLLSTLLLFARTFPENIFQKPYTYNSTIGLAGILELLMGLCENVNVRTNAKVTNLLRSENAWYIETQQGRFGPYENVIINAPPHAAVRFLGQVEPEIVRLLNRHEYFKARIVIHTDPVYMPKDQKYWGTQNAAVDGEFCEASIWIGGTREAIDQGRKINLFKSWATHRSAESKEIIAERTFLHPVDTPAMLSAIKEFERWQGHDGLFFAGHFTTITDLQETALWSAMQIGETLNPADTRLQALRHRLEAKGDANLDYSIP